MKPKVSLKLFAVRNAKGDLIPNNIGEKYFSHKTDAKKHRDALAEDQKHVFVTLGPDHRLYGVES